MPEDVKVEENDGQVENGEVGAAEPEEKDDARFSWYVVNSFSGYEGRVKAFLEGPLSKKYPGRVGEVLIPVQEVTSNVRGRKTSRKKKLYPGYVFAQFDLTQEMIMDIRAMTNVSGFPPMNRGKPEPLSEEDMKRIRGQVDGAEKNKVVRVPYSVGQTVRVVEGPFKNFTGVVEAINPERGRVRIIFTIFGRKAPVEIDFSQVRPV